MKCIALFISEKRIQIEAPECFISEFREVFKYCLDSLIEPFDMKYIINIVGDRVVFELLNQKEESVNCFEVKKCEVWIALLTSFEEEIIRDYDGVILHGGALSYHGQLVMFCGEHHSGKTTLISYLQNDDNFQYISEDVVMLKNGKVTGLLLPVRLRKLLTEKKLHNIDIVKEIEDFEGITRYVGISSRWCPSNSVRPHTVIIPKYNNGVNSIRRLEGIEKIDFYIKNNRKEVSFAQMLIEYRKCLADVPFYFVMYTDIDYVKEMIVGIMAE